MWSGSNRAREKKRARHENQESLSTNVKNSREWTCEMLEMME